MSANIVPTVIRVREDGFSRTVIGLLVLSMIAALLLCISVQGAPVIDVGNVALP
jgi:hypothetical protein